MDEHVPSGGAEDLERYKAPEPHGPPVMETPHWSLWLVYLVFRPRIFFRTFVIPSIPVLTAFTAWSYGIVAAMDRVETRVLLSEGQNPFYEFLRQDWTVYWGATALLGVLGGLLYFAIGGWWYRLRLCWSGATDPDSGLARRVYLYASQAYVVPFLVYVLWETATYATPARAALGDDLGGFVVIGALFWSIYVSYRGVRTAFDVRKWPARIWFAILPGLITGVMLAAVLVAMFWGALDRPDVDDPQRIERAAFSLDYPANWELDTADEDYDPDGQFSIEPPFSDAVITFWFFTESMDSQECVEQTMTNLSAAYELNRTRSGTQWGRHDGFAVSGDVAIEGNDYEFVSFCSTDGATPFEILLISEASVADAMRPGFDLIRDSLALHDR